MSSTKENPIRQEKINSYRIHIKALLTGEELGVTKDRLDWDGYLEVTHIWQGAVDKQPLIEAMRDIILKEKEWDVVADTVHIAYILGIVQLKEAIRKLADERLAEVDKQHSEIVRNNVETFLAMAGV